MTKVNLFAGLTVAALLAADHAGPDIEKPGTHAAEPGRSRRRLRQC